MQIISMNDKVDKEFLNIPRGVAKRCFSNRKVRFPGVAKWHPETVGKLMVFSKFPVILVKMHCKSFNSARVYKVFRLFFPLFGNL